MSPLVALPPTATVVFPFAFVPRVRVSVAPPLVEMLKVDPALANVTTAADEGAK